jgi:dimethylargininase
MRVFDFDRALLRSPGQSVVQGLRADNGPQPDYDALCAEHRAYAAALEAAGLSIQILAADEAHPDSVFVEDPALVFTEGAILLRPGAPERAGEVETLRPELEARFERVLTIREGHVDGGDVLVTSDAVLIGLSSRTSQKGARSLIAAIEGLGHRGRIVRPPAGVLHLKTAATLIDEETILTTRACEEAGLFSRYRQIIVSEGEEPAANALRVNDHLMVGARFERTNAMLSREGFVLTPLPVEQIGRIDAGLSCMSLRWRHGRGGIEDI